MVEEAPTQEYGRPRRPNPETVSYLRGLPLDETLAAQQVRAYVGHFQNTRNNDKDSNKESSQEPPEYPPLLTATHAALSSIHNELASLSCEENSSLQVETLIRISCRFSNTAKLAVLTCMSGYWPFMCTHRFGSHVAQTVLRCVVAKCEVNLDEFDEEGRMIVADSYGAFLSNDTGDLSTLLLQTMQELKPFASELAVHVCGTHVLRSAICILSGVEFVDAYATSGNDCASEWDAGPLSAARRGKLKEKKKKKKPTAAVEGEGNQSRQEVTTMKVLSMLSELQSDQFASDSKVLLKEMIDVISANGGKKSSGSGGSKVFPPGELQQRTCHPSAGPLIVQIVRILSHLDARLRQPSNRKATKIEPESTVDRRLGVLPKEPQYSSGSEAEALVHRLLCWDPSVVRTEGSNSNDDQNTGEGDAKQPYAGDIIYGLSGEPRGSILLETILRCCPDSFHDDICNAGGFYDEDTLREYAYHSVSNFVVQAVLNTARSKSQVGKLVKCLTGIIEDGSTLKFTGDDSTGNGTNKRMGIVWRAMEMCATRGSSQDQEQMLHALMRGYASISSTPDDKHVENDASKRKKRSKAKGLSAEECIPLLLGLKPSNADEGGGFDQGIRLVLDPAGARALHHIFHFSERLRSDWVKGLVRVYGQEDLVKIANDGLGSRCIMDGLLDGPSNSVASKLLFAKLSGRLLFLAAERVGHHVVMKLFRALPLEEKAALSLELSQSLNRLGSNAMGRSVMVSCAVKEYLEGENVWKAALAKQEEKDNWLKEIVGEDDDEENAKSKKKRKRKRQKVE
ncbi:hypothetical protein HJC23_007321 [Cyclotella cryptica]|uniref:Nucleolar protein 9 n=1 Tax=Cyclotella cryptica TaxID=29204 RepID=A0ABD3NWJ6_9STRA|eukprot:CCRYP_019290-RA/>CCRYP_019290-RA protein AED:0.22 eAED:0.22 QI:123/1/1/1/1/1/2/2614/794